MAGKGKLENLRPPWKPGESGNLSGRPRRKPIAGALLEVFTEPECLEVAKQVLAQCRKKSPNLMALTLVRDSLDGKPHKSMDIRAEVAVDYGDLMERFRKASE